MDCRYLTVIFLCLASGNKSQLFQQETYDYCDPKLKLCEVFTDHTMCKYPVPGLSPQCTPAVHEPLSATEKKRILFWHNKFRSNVANGTEKNKSRKLPTSSNMRQIYWDNELEAIATRWAEQCTSTSVLAYDKCRNTKRFHVSQNVGTRQANGTSIDKQAPQIVITWYKEGKDFDPALVDKFAPVGDGKVLVKQFANIIWAYTYAIGCARVIFQEQLPSERNGKPSVWTFERLVCNYGPGGNEIGKPVYKRGISCENCPDGTQCSRVFPGLCAIQNAEKLEGQQNLESQEPKDEIKAETEASTREQEPTTESPVSEEERQETTVEEEPEDRILSSVIPESEEESEEEEKECEGEECFQRSSTSERATPMTPRHRFNDIIKFPRPTARKKSREVGIVVPSQRDDINTEKRKWIVSNSKKVRREDDKSGGRKMKNGERCKCYVEVDYKGNASCRTHQDIFLLFFFAFISLAEFFLPSFSHFKQ